MFENMDHQEGQDRDLNSSSFRQSDVDKTLGVNSDS